MASEVVNNIISELEMQARDLDWSRTNPCADCPFLKATPWHWGVAGSAALVAQSIEDHNFVHTCHKTDNRPSCDGPRNYPGKTQHCAGAILMLLKTGRGTDLQIHMLHAAERGELDLDLMMDKAKRMAGVHTLWSFMKFYDRLADEEEGA